MFKSLSVAALVFVLPQIAIAQGLKADNCSDVLIPDKYSRSLNREQEIALLRIVETKEQYEKAVKAEAEGSYKFFSASGGYDEYSKRRSEFFSKDLSNFNSKEAEQILTSSVRPDLAKRWIECKHGESGGFFLRLVDIAPDAVTVIASFRPVKGGAYYAETGHIYVMGSETTDGQIRSVIPKNWEGWREFSFLVERTKNTSLRLGINVGSLQDNIHIPYVEPAKEPPFDTTRLLRYKEIVWERHRNVAEMTWTEANMYCDTLSFAGYNDWRLPSTKELQEIRYFYQSTSAVALHESGVGNSFWSSNAAPEGKKWYYDFAVGTEVQGEATAKQNLRPMCVRVMN